MSKLSNREKYLIISIILFIAIYILSFNIINSNNHEGLRDVAVTTNSNEYDKFDLWLTDAVDIKAVPCHLFIKDGVIRNVVNHNITEDQFNREKNTDNFYYPLWDKDIKDINGKNINLENYDLIYITKAKCPACEEQKPIEEKIFSDNKKMNVLIYFIKSTKEDAQDCIQECL